MSEIYLGNEPVLSIKTGTFTKVYANTVTIYDESFVKQYGNIVVIHLVWYNQPTLPIGGILVRISGVTLPTIDQLIRAWYHGDRGTYEWQLMTNGDVKTMTNTWAPSTDQKTVIDYTYIVD
jgi:hypothetical protein